MLGKLSLFINYLKVFEVYIVKRFPSTKLPMIGMVFTYFAAFHFMKTYMRIPILQLYYRNDLIEKNKNKLGKWNF